MNAANKTATINGKTYRLDESCIPTDSRFDAMRAALRERGIVDYVNAHPPRARKRFVQIFLMADGTAQPYNSLTIHEAAKRARELAA